MQPKSNTLEMTVSAIVLTISTLLIVLSLCGVIDIGLYDFLDMLDVCCDCDCE